MVWNTSSLIWEAATPGGGGAGGPATIIDGGDVTQGAKGDVAWVSGDGTVISLLKKIANPAGGGLTDAQLRASAVPVSAAALPLPTGASTSALQTTGNTSLASLANTIDSNLNIRVDIAAVGGLAQPIDVSHGVSGLGTIRVELPTDGTGKVGLNAGGAVIGHVIVDTGSTTAVTNAGLTNLDVALSTRALEAGGNLAAIKAKTDNIPALGQALAAASTPVVLTAAQITTLTPIAGNLEATQLLVKTKTDNLDVALSTRLKAADTLAAVTNLAQMGGVAISLNTGVRDTGTQRVTIATNDVVPVSQATLTKGTQGATGVTTQDLKDAGRNQTNYYMVIQIITTGTDALLALTGYKSDALVAATTTPAVVTAGKRYRLTSVTLEYTSIVTTEGSVRFTLRANTGGVVAIGSPVVCVWEVGQPGTGVSVAGKKNTIILPLPDGIEFAAGTGIGISQVGLSPVGAAAVAGYGRISLTGYEY